MTIEIIHHFGNVPVEVVSTRCQADVQVIGEFQKEWREAAFEKGMRSYKRIERPFQCTHRAVVKIDGKPLCRRHAGMICLDMYVSGQLIRRDES